MFFPHHRHVLALCLMFPLVAAAYPAFAQEYEVAPARSAATNTEMRLSAVEDQMRILTGKVEQNDFVLRRMDQAIQRLQADYDARLTKLESIPPAAIPAAAPPPPPSAPPQATLVPAHVEEDVEPEVPAKGKGDAKTSKADAATAGLNAQEQYDRAFSFLKQANYAEAERAFKVFIDKHAKDKMIDNAKYWYAETFYVRAKFGDAAIAFADAYQQNPKGSKAPDSLLKLAMSLGSMDKKPDACSTLDALRAKYPNAAATIRSRADQERSRMKCK